MYKTTKAGSLVPVCLCLFFFLGLAGAGKLQAETPPQRLSSEKTGAEAGGSSNDIQHFVEILKDEQKRKQLIEQLEAAGADSQSGRKTGDTGSGDASLSVILYEEVVQTGQDAVQFIEHTFTSLPALLDLIKRLVISILLLVAVYLLRRLIKKHLLPRVESRWPLQVLSAFVLGVALASGLLSTWGIDMYSLLSTGAGRAILASLITIIFVVIIAYSTWELINRFLHKHTDKINLSKSWDRRLQTVLPLIRSGLLSLICVITGLVVLAELGINIAPLLAGAGIVGLAIGFGAQTLVKDLLTGFFVLLENTINVDDWVILGGHDGQVESLSIRHVMVRDIYGNLHTVPWSSVVSITNQTRDFGFAVVEVGFAYRENIDEVISVVQQVAHEMRQDAAVNEGILGELQILGLIELGDSSVVVRTRFKTLPFMRWRLERDFRRRIKNRFDEMDIEIPYPHQTIYFGENKQGQASPARIQIQEQGNPAGDGGTKSAPADGSGKTSET